MTHSSEHHADLSVIRLHKEQSIRDVLVGKNYHAVFHGNRAFLNERVSGIIENAEELNGFKQGPVKVIKQSDNELRVRFLKGKEERGPRVVLLADISKADLNKKFWITGRIEKIQQTGGPTLFLVTDGSASLNIKGFAGAGKRAFPELNERDVVRAHVMVIEHEEVLEGEIVSVEKVSSEGTKSFEDQVERIIQERIQPLDRSFLVSSPVLEKLKPDLQLAVRLIKRAIVDNRPIVLKHHADTDGYSAAIVLERSILPLILEQHGDEKALSQYYVRTPSKAPYYDYYDATKDLSMALSDAAKFNDKMPLVIIVDTGSGPENEFSIQTVKLFGCQVIVMDHHFFETDPITSLVDCHINPHRVGSQTDFSAGMLCTEVARLISDRAQNIDYIPALAGLADRIESNELKQYLAVAQKEGYSPEYLKQLGTLIDFEAWNFRFSESRELVDALFGIDKEKQRELCNIVYPRVVQMMQRQLEISKQFVETKTIGGVVFAKIDVENTSNFGVYPNPGKAVGNLHDWLQTQYFGKPVLTVGYGSDFITLRATDGTNFAVSAFVQESIKAIPKGGIEGGGHEHAGSLRFVPAVKEQMLQKIEQFVQERN